ncbi:Uncharacterised protein [Mycobacteroides abscessus subsp. abscessus]|nr:Uncharacterised protein [Mycobacteroides abscessus subsp. abscessus]
MRGREDVVVLLPVLEAEEVGTEGLPAPGLLVHLGGQEGGEVDFLRPGAGHLLAHDRLDLPEHGESERQPRVDAGGRTADVAGAVEELVAGDFGADRVFLLGPDEQRRHAQGHGRISLGDSGDRSKTIRPRARASIRLAVPVRRCESDR